MRDEATEHQVRAADPDRSTWLSANAGSGKTRVLTDRVARILLGGAPPERILCLTYTKAAANEMQNRLFRRLGEWSMAPEDQLQNALDQLGVDPASNTPALRSEARTLFARAIEVPGGLKIQTIHSFCASLLRRFPLEAGVSPQFREMDDRAGRHLIDQVLEDMSLDRGVIDTFADELTSDEFSPVLQEMVKHRETLDRLSDGDVYDAFGVPAENLDDHVLSVAFRPGDRELIEQVCAVLTCHTKTMVTLAGELAHFKPDHDWLGRLAALFLHKGGDDIHLPKFKSLPTPNAAKDLGPLLPAFHDLMQRVSDAHMARLGHDAARRMCAMLSFARVFLPRYAQAKERAGFLDFDDLILGTRALLTNPSVADWVLYRLDGGIDHILVDEAQDTSPAQWDVIRLLAREFTTGQGAHPERERTIFVVGDKKQSIYSFQGADPDAFDRMQLHFDQALGHVGQRLWPQELLFSFRSSPALMRLVDLTFLNGAEAGLGGETLHRAFKSDLPGRIDLYPPIPKGEKSTDAAWYDPVDMPGNDHESVVLARQIADRIGDMLGQPLPDESGRGRPIHAGDFLILVQRRSDLFHEVIRACKARGLPIAGADRLRVGAEIAVRDLTALMSFLATPEDDLALASVLRSPLFGWDEGRLFDLAHPRQGQFLYAAMRAGSDGYADELGVLQDLLNQADFLRPYDMLERILIRHDGRRKLLARLGDEAEEGIDAMLTLAMQYEQTEIPDLGGFVDWLATDQVEIKRQAESAGKRIRVMTVHGAKGLEAPIVILPDTAKRRIDIRDALLNLPNGGLGWKTPANASPPVLVDARAAQISAQEAERLRLLYVAMTRAKQWLIVAAAGDVGKEPSDSWYNLIARGMERIGAEPNSDGAMSYRSGDWSVASDTDGKTPEPLPALPDWVRQSPAPAPPPETVINPSLLPGAKTLPGEPGDGSPNAMARGSAIHLLLEHLPGKAKADWPEHARALLADLPAEIAQDALAEAGLVLTSPSLAHVFAPDTLSEVAVTARIGPGQAPMSGVIDRLIVAPDVVDVIDFKSNTVVPSHPEEVPEGLLRQMAAYEEAVGQIYPGRDIRLSILWIATASLMPISHEIVRSLSYDPLHLDPAPGRS